VSFSTLRVTLHEPRPIIVGADGGPWRTLLSAFSLSAQNFVVTVAAIIAAAGEAIPMIGCVVAASWGVRAWWRRRRRSANRMAARLSST
jgi:hypothetical protein